jgi:hypothetical protein
VVTRDRSGATMCKVISTANTVTLPATVKTFISLDTVFCTGGSMVLLAWHIQNVNVYHSRLKAWVVKSAARSSATCQSTLVGSVPSTAPRAMP